MSFSFFNEKAPGTEVSNMNDSQMSKQEVFVCPKEMNTLILQDTFATLQSMVLKHLFQAETFNNPKNHATF